MFLTNPLPSDNEKLPPYPMPYPKYLYLSTKYLYLLKSVVFLVNVIAPNKEFPNTKSLPTVNGHKFIS